jgi:hypothetical protein
MLDDTRCSSKIENVVDIKDFSKDSAGCKISEEIRWKSLFFYQISGECRVKSSQVIHVGADKTRSVG